MQTDMKNKICIVTGANAGIGKATAAGLASMGTTVVMVCRSREKGEAAKAEIVRQTGNDTVELAVCDLALQSEIRRFAEEFKQKHDRLDVLVNNAGIALYKREVTAEGIERTFAVNHLAYFLLTNLLIDLLKASAPARIVNVSSMLHAKGKIGFDDIQMEKKYSLMRAYGDTKLANVLFTYELARRLEGTGVTANCLHPGGVATNIYHNMGVPWWAKPAIPLLTRNLIAPEKGAETSLHLATSPEVEGVTGKYFDEKKEKKSSRLSYDENVAKRLWDVSLEMTG